MHDVNEVLEILKEKLNYRIPLETEDAGILMNYLFTEGNPDKLNQILECLISCDNSNVVDCVWRYFPMSTEYFHFSAKVMEFAEKRKRVVKEQLSCKGNLYNRTEKIPYENGFVVPLDNTHREILREAMMEDIENAQTSRETFEIECFRESVESANRMSGRKPSFVAVDKENELIGYISLTKGNSFSSMRYSPNTYNIEYYTMPNRRRKGLMRAPLIAFLDAVSQQKIKVLRGDAMLCYGIEPEILPIKMIEASIYKDNIASIKLTESLNQFERMGIVKLVNCDNEIDEVCYYTKVF